MSPLTAAVVGLFDDPVVGGLVRFYALLLVIAALGELAELAGLID